MSLQLKTEFCSVAQENKQKKTSVQNKRFVMTLEKSINIRGKLY